MANIISSKIADFIIKFPPFDKLEADEVLRLSEEAEVLYFKAGETVFKQKEKARAFIYFLKEGQVLLRETNNAEKKLVDICDEGELFGVRAMLTGNPYVFEAYCQEESLVYAFPLKVFKPIVESNNHVSLFFASGLASGQKTIGPNTIYRENKRSTISDFLSWQKPLEELNEPLLKVESKTSIQSAAQKMAGVSDGLIVIDEDGKPLGIVTDTDFRSKVAVGIYSIDHPISEIMSTNLISRPLGLPLAEYLISMLKHNIKHLLITKEDELVGIFSQQTLFSHLQFNPFSILYNIEYAENVEKLCHYRNKVDQFLGYYLEQNIKTFVISQLITTVNDALIKKAIHFAITALEEEKYFRPDVPFAWLSLGSEGREEQLLRTDQDNAIIFGNVNAAQLTYTREYFIQLGRRVNDILYEAGFEYCPANMMAGNPDWCLSISEWQDRFGAWIHSPEKEALLFSTIFFDYRFIYGDEELVKKLNNFLVKEIQSNKIFLNFLAKNATKNPPPLSFFKSFVVERSGSHKEEFDLKARAMMPLTDIARILCLDAGNIAINSTLERYRFLAEKDKSRKDLFLQAMQAYEFLMHFRASEGIRNKDSGRFIPIKEISKFDRQVLRNSFEPISDLQQMIELKFQLNYFS
jgi:CBS domain-containing protein